MSENNNLSLIERAVNRLVDNASDERAGIPDPVDVQSGTDAASEKHSDRSVASTSSPKSSRHSVELDLARLKAEGYAVPADGRSQLAEECRMIKRPLLNNAFGLGATLVPDGNLIMVTSTYPGEGKTFTAINLAMSLAKEIDKTVLLVDADVGRSNIFRVLGTPPAPGLLDVLLDHQLDLADVILGTNVPNLRLLPKGRSHSLANELLASEGMAQITRQLADRYPDRVVIFDSPPLLITNEAAVLSSYMGQIVFVVEAERTAQSAVKAALALLDPEKPIGLVLNKTRKSIGMEYYGYGYHDRPQETAA